MASLTPEELDDLVNLTLPYIPKKGISDISLEHTEYVASRILASKLLTERGGTSITFKVNVRNTGLARNTGILAEDVTGIEDTTISASVPWTKQTVNWSYSVDEPEFQGDAEMIVDELKVRDFNAQNDMAELNEENLWGGPTSSTDKRPMGIPWWFQKDANTAANDGTMNGGNPSGWTGRAGISSTDYARWKNFTFRYAAVTPDDLVRKVKLAMYKTTFKAPVNNGLELKFGSSPQREIYTTFRVSEPLERLAESRNENLGSDLAKFMYGVGGVAGVTIGGVPVLPVPYLDSNDTNDPLYGVNWQTFRPFVLKGKNMRRMGPMQMPNQHDGKTVHYDTFMNYRCENLRKNWVGSLATS